MYDVMRTSREPSPGEPRLAVTLPRDPFTPLMNPGLDHDCVVTETLRSKKDIVGIWLQTFPALRCWCDHVVGNPRGAFRGFSECLECIMESQAALI